MFILSQKKNFVKLFDKFVFYMILYKHTKNDDERVVIFVLFTQRVWGAGIQIENQKRIRFYQLQS